MKQEKKENRSGNLKIISLILALSLIAVAAVGGTIAWLIATTEPVVNTFTYGDINIELQETDTGLDGDGSNTTNQYKMIPGQTIEKDPEITVKKGSEAMYLFVKLEKSANFDSFMEYTVAAGWTALSGEDGVYYRQVSAAEVENNDMTVSVIEGDTVTVKTSVTKDMLNALDVPGAAATYPTLTVSAYAIQEAGSDTAAQAWAKITTP